MKNIILVVLILMVLPACTGTPTQFPQVRPIESVLPSLPVVSPSSVSTTPPANPTEPIRQSPQASDIENCQPAIYTIPTLPAVIPRYTELDESIGLHVTGSYQIIDPETYRLKISGMVDNPLDLTYDQIRCLPKVTANPLLVCPGFFEDSASWTGVTIKTILDLAGDQEGASELVFVSADGYRVRVPIVEALDQESLLAYEVNGEILPILHGFPVRVVLPDRSGGQWIKWLVEIQVI